MKTSFAVVVMLALAAPALAEAPQVATPPLSPASPALAIPAEQGERPAAPPPPPAPPPASERRPLPRRNVKVDVTITEQSGKGSPMKKLVSFVVADGRSSGVRSTTNLTYARRASPTAPPVYNQRALPLNVDSTVTVTEDQRVLLDLRFNYGSLQPTTPLEPTAVAGGDSITTDSLFGEITENLSVLLTPGTPVVISRSADATSDRTVTVEVKAEILK